MISQAYITHWAAGAPWPTLTQIEQDLLLSRLICEIANDPYLGEELVFRGGTCFHKLHLSSSRRYSEDLDYVRATSGGIAPLTRALTTSGETLGLQRSPRRTLHSRRSIRSSATTCCLWWVPGLSVTTSTVLPHSSPPRSCLGSSHDPRR